MHGIVLKDGRIIKAFGKIGKKLKEQGYCVYIGKHDGFGTVENNAEQLKTQIQDILARENVEKVNLIAHSKGGLDCKYLIRELGMEDSVASLTTLCTPHKGSPVASRIMKLPNFLLKFVAFWINFCTVFSAISIPTHTVCARNCSGTTMPNNCRFRIRCIAKAIRLLLIRYAMISLWAFRSCFHGIVKKAKPTDSCPSIRLSLKTTRGAVRTVRCRTVKS